MLHMKRSESNHGNHKSQPGVHEVVDEVYQTLANVVTQEDEEMKAYHGQTPYRQCTNDTVFMLNPFWDMHLTLGKFDSC